MVVLGDFNVTGGEHSNPQQEQTDLEQVMATAGLHLVPTNPSCSAYWEGSRRDGWKEPSLLDLVWASENLHAPSLRARPFGPCAAHACQALRSTAAYPDLDLRPCQRSLSGRRGSSGRSALTQTFTPPTKGRPLQTGRQACRTYNRRALRTPGYIQEPGATRLTKRTSCDACHVGYMGFGHHKSVVGHRERGSPSKTKPKPEKTFSPRSHHPC